MLLSADANGRLLYGLSSADISVNFRPMVMPVYETWYKYGILVDVSCVQTAGALFEQVDDVFDWTATRADTLATGKYAERTARKSVRFIFPFELAKLFVSDDDRSLLSKRHVFDAVSINSF